MTRRIVLALLMAAGIAAAYPVAGHAQAPYDRGYYGGQVMPLDRILPNVRNGRAGRFYDAEGPFPDASGGYHYRIKWLTPQGRVIWLDTDARTGHVLGVAPGDWREQGPPAFGPYGAPRSRFEGPPGGPYAAPRGYGMPGGRIGAPRGGRGFGGFRGGGRRRPGG